MKPSEPSAVLLMAYGSPEELADVEAYYTQIRGGKKPAPHLVENLKARYRAIGGKSSLNGITHRQAQRLEAGLQRRFPEAAPRVYIGMKHWHPFVDEAVNRMADDGIEAITGLVMAPHYSRMSVATYLDSAGGAASARSIAFQGIQEWSLHPSFRQFWTRRVTTALQRFSDSSEVGVVFTAHSLPQRIQEWNDPYPQQLHTSAEQVASAAGLTQWQVAYQSAGRTQEPWLGPDLLHVLDQLHGQGTTAVLVCPIGFVADHLEVLYDIDIEAKRRAASLGIQLERTVSPNADPQFIDVLVDVVSHAWKKDTR